LSRPASPLRLAGVHLKVSALHELQYRVNFWVQLVNSLLAVGTGLVAIAVVYLHTETLEGWTSPELLAVLGVHTVIGGVLRTFVEPNMWQLISDVEWGRLDYTLTRPADSQLIVSVRQVNIWSSIDIALGVGIIVWSVLEMPGELTVSATVAFVIASIFGSIIIYSMWLAAVTVVFKTVNIGDLMQVLGGIYEAGRWPVGIYPLWLRGALTVVFPLAFAITVPAEVLSGRVGWWWVAAAAAVTVVAFLACRRLWMWGIRNYSGASA
jgi:ABC-2 type transport system permease protein